MESGEKAFLSAQEKAQIAANREAIDELQNATVTDIPGLFAPGIPNSETDNVFWIEE